jgi:hypothetical protein
MKKVALLAVAVLFAAVATPIQAVTTDCNTAPIVNLCGGDDHGMSVMTLKVKKVVNHQDKAEALKTDLMKLQGVKDVSACTHSGTVTVKYNKAELGCCSKIHAALKESKWKYELVSNEEKPACNKEGKKMCPASKQKGA